MRLIQHIYRKEDHLHCPYNWDVFNKLQGEFPDLRVEEFEADDERGKDLAQKYGASDYPVTIVNGVLYTIGGVDEEKLRELLNKAK